MTRTARWCIALSLVCLTSACASERAPINRVQPNALEKSFFVGRGFADPADDPQFYYRPTVVDVDYGAAQSGLFTASYAQSTARVRWEITEELLLARLTYERIEGSTGNGVEETDSGQIAAAFKIDKHFDVRRDYNPQTGEELNILEENDSDRPWYEREFMRVDWSQNLVTSAYELDTLAALRIYADEPLVYEPVSYSVEDPASPDAPEFVPELGYFDITNKLYVTPQMLDTPYGAFPACFFSPDAFGGGYPVADCNPVEVKVRLSFRRIDGRDYQPVDWDGTRMDMFGMFTTGERRGYDRNYGVVDDKWYRFASRHNIWEQSHARDRAGELVRCNYFDPESGEGTPPGADPDRDANPVNGTADECESVGGGSRCDRFTHACTLPYREREVRTTPFYYGPESDPTLWDTVRDSLQQWDDALRHAVQTARFTECVRATQAAAEPSQEELNACRSEYPTTEEAAREAVPPVFVFCHNPVAEDDDPACGKPGMRVRVGDLRYNMANVIQDPQTPSPWGILADAIDPLTGEVVAASVNVWNAITDIRTQLTVDQMRWYLGEISNDDVSSGRYLNDYLSSGNRAPIARAQTLPVVDEKQILRRIGGIDRSLKAEAELSALPRLNQRQLVDWASERVRTTFGDTVLGSGNTGARARLELSRGSALEASLTSAPWLRLAGLDPSLPVSESALEMASPLRGNALNFRSELERLRDLHLAQHGRCMLSAPEPTSVTDWARILAKKFPLPENAGPSELLERNQKWHDYLRRKLTYGVMLHEMGHSMGLRHVFTSSFDALNFHPQYWQLRTRDGAETAYCNEVTSDGSDCVGPRWRDPVTDAEHEGMIWMWQHTSVMDYPGDLSQEGLGIGAYDRAAIRFAYADVTDVIADQSVRCTARGNDRACTPNGTLVSDLIDGSFGGISGPWYNDGETFFHYSQLGQRMNLVRDCRPADTSAPPTYDADRDGVYSPVFDGLIVNGTVCGGLPVDYVAYSELQLEEPGFQQAFGAFGGPARKFDALGRVRRPYMFGSDEYADIGNLAVLRDDNGADAYEVVNFLINNYEDAHVWDNYRRNRSTFSLRNAFSRGYLRYNGKLKEIGKGFGLFTELLSGTGLLDVYTTGELGDGLLKASAIATSMTFDHFARILTRPNSGEHFLDEGYDPRGTPVFRSIDQALEVNAPPSNGLPTLSLQIPDGSLGIGVDVLFGGRPLFNELDRSKGYYATQYDLWVGSYYDKTLVADMLTDAEDRFISTSRDDFADGRYRNISFATVFPEGVRRLIAAALTEDQSAIGWRVESEQGEPMVGRGSIPSAGLGYRSFWPQQGSEICWRRSGALICKEFPSELGVDDSGPSESLPIDPEVSFEVQKFIVFWAMVNLPETWKLDWVDLMRVYRLGENSLVPFPAEEQAVWVDPVSGDTYVAHRHGSELVEGAPVDRGISARVIDWMNLLSSRAYEVEATDPVTGALTYAKYLDDSACPTGVSTCAGQPVVRTPRFVARVKGYKSLIEFMHQVTMTFGFDSPNWRGVY